MLVLPASPYDLLPDSLEEVLKSRPLTNAADGMLYREFLAEAAAELGLEVRRLMRARPTRRPSRPRSWESTWPRCGLSSPSSVARRCAPWRKDHKLAAAAGLWALGSRLRR